MVLPFLGALLLAAAVPAPPESPAGPLPVAVVPAPDRQRVDVRVDGQPFTAYLWPPRLKKPVLYPLRTPRGTLITRGFPLDPRPGESVDHPHHVGLWLNYGDVSGVDFWNHSDARGDDAARMGTVAHRRVVDAGGGPGEGTLEVEADWVMPGGPVSLAERTRYVFRAEPDARLIDRTTTLTARRHTVLGESKEGLLGIRVARELEHPGGVYLSSEGRRGEAVWGTRARWVALSGRIGREEVTLLVLDHPRNPNHPTYWHARGYGLFAANPIAARSYRKEEGPRSLALAPGESVTLRYRVVIRSRAMSPAEADADFERFAR